MHGPRCGAKTRTGKPCTNRPIKGGKRCRMHGGASPQAKAAAEQRITRATIGARLAEIDPGYDGGDPLTNLITAMTMSAWAVEALSAEVRELEAIYGFDHLSDARPHVIVMMWNEERDRFAKLCKMALDAGIDERQVQLAEDQGQLVARVVNALIDDPALGLSIRKKQIARKQGATHLRAIGGVA